MTIGTAESICKCGLAKSYHPRLAIDHEYEPRYLPTGELDPDPLYVEPDPIPDRPRFPLATWTVLVAIVAIGIVAFLIANRGGA